MQAAIKSSYSKDL